MNKSPGDGCTVIGLHRCSVCSPWEQSGDSALVPRWRPAPAVRYRGLLRCDALGIKSLPMPDSSDSVLCPWHQVGAVSKYIKQRRAVSAMLQSAQGNALGNRVLHYYALKGQKHCYPANLLFDTTSHG